MSNRHPTPEHAAHTIVTLLDQTAHVATAYWPQAQDARVVAGVDLADSTTRITRLCANLLNALVDGNPPAADEAIHSIDTLFAAFPGVDTTPGAC